MHVLVLGAVAAICGAFLFWQSGQRTRFTKREVLEAAAARTSVIAVLGAS